MRKSSQAAGVRILALGATLLMGLFSPARAASIHVTWDNLTIVSGHTVRVFLPDGVITGKAIGVEEDALLVNVRNTSNPKLYPKGTIKIARQRLHTFNMQTKGKWFRATFTTGFGLLGLGGGAAAAWVIDDCQFWGGCGNHRVAAGFAVAGITAAGAAGGYFLGNALDKHWTTIEIVQ